VATTSSTGAFALLGFAPGTYTLTAQRPGMLDMETSATILPFVVVNMGEALMAGGDVNQSGAVTVTDLSAALAAFGTCSGDPGFDPLADQNGNGCVDAIDFAIINDNMGRVAPTLWVPVP
jgi:hypothetical protein